MCAFFAVSRSGCYAFVHRPGRPEKEAALAERIAQQQERSFQTYGYRQMWLWLKSQNIFRNPKTVLRIMKKYDLLFSSPISLKSTAFLTIWSETHLFVQKECHSLTIG